MDDLKTSLLLPEKFDGSFYTISLLEDQKVAEGSKSSITEGQEAPNMKVKRSPQTMLYSVRFMTYLFAYVYMASGCCTLYTGIIRLLITNSHLVKQNPSDSRFYISCLQGLNLFGVFAGVFLLSIGSLLVHGLRKWDMWFVKFVSGALLFVTTTLATLAILGTWLDMMPCNFTLVNSDMVNLCAFAGVLVGGCLFFTFFLTSLTNKYENRLAAEEASRDN